ncbi:MAG TPA: SDR family NAD(P)-dependent oxidoreductase [Bacteroidota bacterium]|nr:SDR family NAD(P)-dependent oxidoreductase [Bacteroidota bacterium]
MKDNTIVIIGASRGIGAALVREYLARGCHVLAASRDLAALEALRGAAPEGMLDVVQCDAAQPGAVRFVLERAEARWPRVDLLLYNAGADHAAWMDTFTAEDFRALLAVNTSGLAEALECSYALFRRQGGGVFAGVSSLADARGYPGSASYCASKAAASTLLEAARAELRQGPIHVLTVRPGFVRTDMTAKNTFPMPLLMEAAEAARIIVRGIERRKSVITFPWPIAFATRIIRVLPDRLFAALALRGRRRR